MSRIRSSGTKPELKVKSVLRALGFAYQPKMYGNPDFANKKQKIAIFIDGCFWHGCKKHFKLPEQNRKYWLLKIKGNMNRDKEISRNLKKAGWNVIRVWEHELK